MSLSATVTAACRAPKYVQDGHSASGCVSIANRIDVPGRARVSMSRPTSSGELGPVTVLR
jgi:hypothetical protein